MGRDQDNKEKGEKERTKTEADTKSKYISAGVRRHHMDYQKIVVKA